MAKIEYLFLISMDSKHYLENVFNAACVFSYIAVVFNVAILVFLCRKSLMSPCTILMQGLALADALTAFWSYGLQPIFSDIYKTAPFKKSLTLPYPYCALSVYRYLLADTFHFVSVMLTTCLGLQKVIAIRWPLWTHLSLTKKKALISCLMCFAISIGASVPRFLSITFSEEVILLDAEGSHYRYCAVSTSHSSLLNYSALYYTIGQTFLLACFCVIMLACTVYITYKLKSNKLRERQTEHKRQERRSVIMIGCVLAIFLVSEIPKVIIYVQFIAYYLQDFNDLDKEYFSLRIIQNIRYATTYILAEYAKFLGDVLTDITARWDAFLFFIESVRIFTLIGCLSNFIIYVVMSKKLRREIQSICPLQSCQPEDLKTSTYEIRSSSIKP